jgi:hypothetical protein
MEEELNQNLGVYGAEGQLLGFEGDLDLCEINLIDVNGYGFGSEYLLDGYQVLCLV